ncbi:RRP15-like protein [Bacillus rossius redtenbacheri]|uniref:RRP15-like protein n=1 Tax=Bacillus rossius redtenbacheri TaxID=93214 RepID=UPI002FDE2402
MVSKTCCKELLQESISDPVIREDAEDSSSDSGDGHSGSESDPHDSDEENSGEEETHDSKSGWADAIAKILRTNKPRRKRSIVLSRAKKLNEVVKKVKVEEPEFDVDVKDDKPDVKDLSEEQKLVEKLKRTVPKNSWASKGRVKPNILDKDRERVLSKIATKGVVQLFNVVRQQQKTVDVQLKEAGGLFRKEEQAIKSLDKKSFLDMLMGSNAKSEVVDDTPKRKDPVEAGDDEDATWHVLRDDFMMGAKLKDWDKPVSGAAVDNV